LTLEIEVILRKGLTRIITEKGLERFAFRLYHALGDIIKRIDFETYRLFRAVILTEGKEWEEAVADASREDQVAVQDLAKDFFEVLSTLVVPLMLRCLKTPNQQRRI